MPLSVLALEKRTRAMTAEDRALVQLREDILDVLPPYAEHGPTNASTCYVWPSAFCPVGCAHCNYAAPHSKGNLARYSVADDPEPLMRILNSMGLWKAVLSGGGEPMVEPGFCELFINRVNSPQLGEIELITSAHFASSLAETRERLMGLVVAWRSRSPDLARANFTIRISLDWFHAERIGVEPTARVVTLLGEAPFSDVQCYIRSVLLENDSTIHHLANRLGARIGKIEDYEQELLLPDGRTILVYYKNLIVDGRMSYRKLERLPVGIPVESRASVFRQRFLDSRGKHVPARVYNGPEVRHLDGLACLIEDNGTIKINDGTDPYRAVNVRDFAAWDDAVAALYADPLTVFLVDNGPEPLAELLADAFPDARTVAADTNQLYHLTDRLLATADRRLYAMLRVLEMHIAEGRMSIDQRLLDGAWAALKSHGFLN
jgi:hypothetical protein